MTLFRFNRFASVLAAIIALSAFSGWAQSLIITNSRPQAIPRRASIIFIQCDGLGYGDLSCYGQANYQTPNLDKLAAEGVRFTNYFASDSAPVTRASLMLGKDYPAASRDIPLAPPTVTVAQALRLAGYRTGYIGEWDLGDENSLTAPWKKGFDEFAGFFNGPDATNFYSDRIFHYSPRTLADAPEKAAHFVGYEELYRNTGGNHGMYLPDLYSQAAVNFVKENVPDRFNRYRPFFLFVNYVVPDEHLRVPSDAPYSDESWPQAEKNRAALISRIDGSIGELRQQLDKLQMTNNVLIFFAGGSIPHRTAEMDPAFFHSNLATNDFHVPMIAHWPAHISPGRVSGFEWEADDFLPTAVQIGYTATVDGIDGTSILAELGGRRQ